MTSISIDTKSDRELLLLAIQKLNDIDDKVRAQNGRVRKHDRQITVLQVVVCVLTAGSGIGIGIGQILGG
jgi:hypothetical protein